MSKLISVVIPAYNEAQNLPALASIISGVFETLGDYAYECLIVNDGSTDDTRAVLETLSHRFSQVRPIHMMRNSGQSAALLAGMRLARGEYILTLDADLQNDPRDFPALINQLDHYDCVCGYREKRNDPWGRRWTSRMGNLVRRWIVDDGIRDAGCGIKGFRRNCIEHVVPFHGVHRFFAAMVRNGGLTVTEIPVSHHPRRYGVSKYGVANRLFWVLYDFFGVAWLRRRYLRIDIEECPVTANSALATAQNTLSETEAPSEVPINHCLPVGVREREV